jgi:H+/Cl- antiporter ClcA
VNASPEAPQITGTAYLRLIALGAVIGVPAALIAAGFLAFVHELEDWLWHDLPDALGHSSPPWYLVVGLPVAGACIVVAARKLLPGDGGHSPLDGLAGSPTPVAYAPGVALAAVGTLAFGAVLGPEAPLIALGSVVGLLVTRFVTVDEKHHPVLAMAGSFSAISALFGSPLVAGVLLIEAGVGMGALLIPVLLPGLVAAAVGYLLFIGLGDWGGLDQTALSIPGLPPYDGTSIRDLLLALAIGIATAFLCEAVRIIGRRTAGSEPRFGLGPLLMGGGLAVGLLAVSADALGADSQDVLFSGQFSMVTLVGEDSAAALLVLLAAKALGYAICLGCGFRGGPVFPAIFLGVGLAMFAVIAFDVSPTLAVAVGTSAGIAAMTKLLFAPLLFAALLVGSSGLDAISAAVLASAAAWVTTNALERLAGAAVAAGQGEERAGQAPRRMAE